MLDGLWNLLSTYAPGYFALKEREVAALERLAQAAEVLAGTDPKSLEAASAAAIPGEAEIVQRSDVELFHLQRIEREIWQRTGQMPSAEAISDEYERQLELAGAMERT